MSESSLTEHEDVFLDREIAKNACLTLKKYFEAHITILCNEYRKTSLHYPSQDVPVYKVTKFRCISRCTFIRQISFIARFFDIIIIITLFTLQFHSLYFQPMIITPESIGESIECIICNGEDTALQKQLVKVGLFAICVHVQDMNNFYSM